MCKKFNTVLYNSDYVYFSEGCVRNFDKILKINFHSQNYSSFLDIFFQISRHIFKVRIVNQSTQFIICSHISNNVTTMIIIKQFCIDRVCHRNIESLKNCRKWACATMDFICSKFKH
ncbi:hypothetical protein HZS_4091 [Henneguya salminicola]|nr:hypothetical protein HZS_4091 [Henneguya salminicola]